MPATKATVKKTAKNTIKKITPEEIWTGFDRIEKILAETAKAHKETEKAHTETEKTLNEAKRA